MGQDLSPDLASARLRWAEQFMSDERLLGALPDDASGPLLDHLLAQLDQAAVRAASVENLDAAAERLYVTARAQADQAAETDDPLAFLRAAWEQESTAAGAPSGGPVAAAAPTMTGEAAVGDAGIAPRAAPVSAPVPVARPRRWRWWW